ncbi:MAG TPA: hypothetical protein VMT22_17330 [Terriglobales bacterium]|jgi:hypothetical protein|nr:hypothetical protein [Terriglobales bacterium]
METIRLFISRAAAQICFITAMAALASGHLLAQDVRTHEEVAKILSLENETATDDGVSAEVVNRSRNVVRDVQLLIRHIWLWDRETKPGANDPSTSTYYALGKDIPPGGRISLNYKPTTPLPRMAGGHFITTVSIAGFAEVIPQSR